MVMFALIPYLALSAALDPLTPIIAKQLHTSLQTMSLSPGLDNAAYAVGTVLGVQFAQHLPQRRMMVCCSRAGRANSQVIDLPEGDTRGSRSR